MKLQKIEINIFLFSSSMTPDEFNQDSEDVFVNPIFENENCHWTDHEYEIIIINLNNQSMTCELF